METKQTAHIEDWFVLGNTLVGKISKHPRQDEFKAEFQRTSGIVSFDEENGVCETRNTVYTLGKKKTYDYQAALPC